MILKSADPEVRLLATLALAALRQPHEAEHLCAAIAGRHDLACLALGASDEHRHVKFLTEQLRGCDIAEIDRIVGLVLALRALGADAEPADAARLGAPSAPHAVRSLFQRVAG